MGSRKSNIFVGDQSFTQHWTLAFKEPGTERKFLAESLRIHQQSLQWIYIWSGLILIYFWMAEEIPFYHCVFCLSTLVLSKISKETLIKRFLLQAICIVWEANLLKFGTISECFGVFLPSFILNFFLLKSWTKALFFFTGEVLVLYWQTGAPLVNLTISALTYVLLSCNLEKDFRDLWHLYSSYKKSSNLNKGLWDTNPGAQLLIDNQGNIVKYNKAAVEVLKKQNKPIDVVRTGKFENFFQGFNEQAKNLLEKAFQGEMSEEIYTSGGSDENKLKPELGYLLIGDLVSWTSGNCVRVMCLDVSYHLSKKMLILKCFRDIYSLVDHVSKQISKIYSEKTSVTKETLTAFNRVYQFFMGTMALQSHFTGTMELHIANFDINAEIFNTIELLFLKSSHHKVTIVYTREKGIPPTISGDKSLHNALLFTLLDFIIDNSIQGSEIFLLTQVNVTNK